MYRGKRVLFDLLLFMHGVNKRLFNPSRIHVEICLFLIDRTDLIETVESRDSSNVDGAVFYPLDYEFI